VLCHVKYQSGVKCESRVRTARTFSWRDPDQNRLEIRDESHDGENVCSVTVENREDLMHFFEGLRRALSSTKHEAAQAPPRLERNLSSSGTESSESDRAEVVNAARKRNAIAFAPWSPSEEEDIRQRYEAGEDIESIARDSRRSARSIETRLKRIGVSPKAD
jgi:hypothetical protein